MPTQTSFNIDKWEKYCEEIHIESTEKDDDLPKITFDALKNLWELAQNLRHDPKQYAYHGHDIHREFDKIKWFLKQDVTKFTAIDPADYTDAKRYQIEIGAIIDYLEWRNSFWGGVVSNFLGGLSVEFVTALYRGRDRFSNNGNGGSGTGVNNGDYGRNHNLWRDRILRNRLIYAIIIICTLIFVGSLLGVTARQNPDSLVALPVRWSFQEVNPPEIRYIETPVEIPVTATPSPIPVPPNRRFVGLTSLLQAPQVNLGQVGTQTATWQFKIPDRSTYYMDISISALDSDVFEMRIEPDGPKSYTRVRNSNGYIFQSGTYELSVTFNGNVNNHSTRFRLIATNHRNIICIKKIDENGAPTNRGIFINSGTLVYVTGIDNSSGHLNIFIPQYTGGQYNLPINDLIDPDELVDVSRNNTFPDCELFN